MDTVGDRNDAASCMGPSDESIGFNLGAGTFDIHHNGMSTKPSTGQDPRGGRGREREREREREGEREREREREREKEEGEREREGGGKEVSNMRSLFQVGEFLHVIHLKMCWLRHLKSARLF